MSNTETARSLSSDLAKALPYLRRHARALTGNQAAGDDFAMDALQMVRDDKAAVMTASSIKVGLFRMFFVAWQCGDHGATSTDDGGLAGQAQTYLRELTPHSRQALLLHAIEEFSLRQIAEIMDKPVVEIEKLISFARQEMKDAVKGRIMVIEDEAMIAMDLEDIVSAMGHTVVGAAATRDQAVVMAEREKPDLILSDIQLADGSSGIDAVNDIMQAAADTPVIFITAFPERLLTGDRQEPAFVITKPYSQEQVQSAVSQAMFFRSSSAISV